MYAIRSISEALRDRHWMDLGGHLVKIWSFDTHNRPSTVSLRRSYKESLEISTGVTLQISWSPSAVQTTAKRQTMESPLFDWRVFYCSYLGKLQGNSASGCCLPRTQNLIQDDMFIPCRTSPWILSLCAFHSLHSQFFRSKIYSSCHGYSFLFSVSIFWKQNLLCNPWLQGDIYWLYAFFDWLDFLNTGIAVAQQSNGIKCGWST